jgi:peptidoglycan/LPS O-acetylase OafA/YrhL
LNRGAARRSIAPVEHDDRTESRFATEIRFLVVVAFALAVICGALIAQPFWGNGAMVAILAVGIVIYLIAKHAPGLSSRHTPRTH